MRNLCPLTQAASHFRSRPNCQSTSERSASLAPAKSAPEASTQSSATSCANGQAQSVSDAPHTPRSSSERFTTSGDVEWAGVPETIHLTTASGSVFRAIGISTTSDFFDRMKLRSRANQVRYVLGWERDLTDGQAIEMAREVVAGEMKSEDHKFLAAHGILVCQFAATGVL